MIKRNFNFDYLRMCQGSTHPEDIYGAILTINDIEKYINYLENRILELENGNKEM